MFFFNFYSKFKSVINHLHTTYRCFENFSQIHKLPKGLVEQMPGITLFMFPIYSAIKVVINSLIITNDLRLCIENNVLREEYKNWLIIVFVIRIQGRK